MERVIVNPEVEGYLTKLLGPAAAVQAEMEALAGSRRFPIVGPLVGRLLDVLTRSIGATRVLELGSGFGYSAFWFLQAMGSAGRLVHTEYDAANSALARDFLGRAGFSEQVVYEVGDAREVAGHHAGPFDIVFCDIDKEQYPDIPDLALPKLRRGGLLIFDNTLWSGRVVDGDGDGSTRAVVALNRSLHARSDVRTTIVPVRDGVSISIKL